MEGYSTIILLVLMIGIFYFMLIRPENKKKKEVEAMRNAVAVGDEITTIGAGPSPQTTPPRRVPQRPRRKPKRCATPKRVKSALPSRIKKRANNPGCKREEHIALRAFSLPRACSHICFARRIG